MLVAGALVAGAWMGSVLPAADGYRVAPLDLVLRVASAATLWSVGLRLREPLGLRAAGVLCAVGLLLGCVFADRARRPAPLTLLQDAPGGMQRPRWLRGAVGREPAGAAQASRMLIDVEEVLVGGRWLALRGRVEIRVPTPPPRPNWYRGTKVELFVRLQPDRPPANPGTRQRDRLRDRGIDLRGTLKDWTQVRLRSPPPRGPEVLPGKIRDLLRQAIERHHAQSGLVRALLLGERSAVSDSFWQQLDRSGLLHLLAISGLHVGLLIGTAHLTCRMAGLSPLGSTIAGLTVVAMLLLLVEPRAPVQRAAIMAGSFLSARLISGRTHPADSLAGAVVILVTLAPLGVRDLGLQLSTVATAGLLAGAGLFNRRGPVLNLLSAAVVAQIAVAPLLALERWRVLPLGALWNLPAVPLLAAALPSAIAAAACEIMARTVPIGTLGAGFGSAAGALASVADQLLILFRDVCALGARGSPSVVLPAITWPMAWGYWAGLGTVTLSTKRWVRLLGVCLLAGSVWAAAASLGPGPVTLVSFDVGQGDAVLLQGPQGSVLYDAGGYPGLDYDIGYHLVSPQLRRRDTGRLSALAISHAHADHAGGAAGVLREIGAAAVWVGSAPPASALMGAVFEAAGEAAATTLSPHAGLLPAAGCLWRVLSPTPATLLRGATKVHNGASLAFDALCAGRRVVLAGDADTRAERDWIANGLAPGSGPVILKVGHHGSDTSTGVQLLDHLRPRHALISVGASNPWGLPRDSVLRALYRRGISVYRTDRDGAVTITLGSRTRVRAERWVRGPR